MRTASEQKILLKWEVFLCGPQTPTLSHVIVELVVSDGSAFYGGKDRILSIYHMLGTDWR